MLKLFSFASQEKRIKGDHFLQQVIYMKPFSSKGGTCSRSPSLTESLCEMQNQSPVHRTVDFSKVRMHIKAWSIGPEDY